jgi:hypothetical protein
LDAISQCSSAIASTAPISTPFYSSTFQGTYTASNSTPFFSSTHYTISDSSTPTAAASTPDTVAHRFI